MARPALQNSHAPSPRTAVEHLSCRSCWHPSDGLSTGKTQILGMSVGPTGPQGRENGPEVQRGVARSWAGIDLPKLGVGLEGTSVRPALYHAATGFRASNCAAGIHCHPSLVRPAPAEALVDTSLRNSGLFCRPPSSSFLRAGRPIQTRQPDTHNLLQLVRARAAESDQVAAAL